MLRPAAYYQLKVPLMHEKLTRKAAKTSGVSILKNIKMYEHFSKYYCCVINDDIENKMLWKRYVCHFRTFYINFYNNLTY